MSHGVTLTLIVPEPFEKALKSIRRALNNGDLRIPMELDMSGRINRELGIALAPCRSLWVDNPILLLEAVALDRLAAVFIPLHLVVSGRGPQTLVHLLSPASVQGSALPAAAKAPINKLQSRILRSLEHISTRQSIQLSA